MDVAPKSTCPVISIGVDLLKPIVNHAATDPKYGFRVDHFLVATAWNAGQVVEAIQALAAMEQPVGPTPEVGCSVKQIRMPLPSAIQTQLQPPWRTP
jgi:hypothetical protein